MFSSQPNNVPCYLKFQLYLVLRAGSRWQLQCNISRAHSYLLKNDLGYKCIIQTSCTICDPYEMSDCTAYLTVLLNSLTSIAILQSSFNYVYPTCLKLSSEAYRLTKGLRYLRSAGCVFSETVRALYCTDIRRRFAVTSTPETCESLSPINFCNSTWSLPASQSITLQR